MINKKFHKLLVIEQVESIKNRSAYKCLCDCGSIKIIRAEHLKSGDTKSCGCLNNEKRSSRAKQMYSTRQKFSPKEASANRVWRKRYKDGLIFEDFLQLSQQNCAYCGAPPNNKYNAAQDDKKSSPFAKENGEFIYNGLDRIDNSKNHCIENVVSCCKFCNYSKRERSLEEFKLWVKLVYNKLFNQKD